MKLVTPEIAWHGKEPVLSVDFCKVGSTFRMASAGADKDIKIWAVTCSDDGSHQLKFLSNLTRHTKAVNVVRFSPKEELLASAGDDSMVFIWKLNSSQDPSGPSLMECDNEIENQETWTVSKALRGHIEDVYDLAWSPDGSQLISGSVDNSAIVWDANKGIKLQILKDHKHYVQGVCWDPLNQYLVTNSSDRSCRLYNPQTYRCSYNINKLAGTAITKASENGEAIKPTKMFHDETMQTFFRRPTFTPDGSLLIVPAGKVELSNQVIHTTYVFTRNSPNKPMCFLQSPKKPTVAVRCCPALFELRNTETDKENAQSTKLLSKLPYRMVFAVATLDSVLLYDTQQKVPFGYIANIHYSGISDMTWSNSGNFLVISSTDGYCSIVQFKEGELGTPYKHSLQEVMERPNTPVNTPMANKQITKSTQIKPTEITGNSVRKPVLPPAAGDTITDPPTNNPDKPEQAVSRKKEPRGISQFTVPMSQMEPKPAAPRRVPLVSAGQTTVSTSQSQPPKRVQLVTLSGQSPTTVNQAGSPAVQQILNGQTVYTVNQPLAHSMQLITAPGRSGPGQLVNGQQSAHIAHPIRQGQTSGQYTQHAPQRVILVPHIQGAGKAPANQGPQYVQLVPSLQAVGTGGMVFVQNQLAQASNVASTLPGQVQMKPVDKSTLPGQLQMNPVDRSTLPGQVQMKPVDRSTLPGQEQMKPVDKSTLPGQVQMKPVDKSGAAKTTTARRVQLTPVVPSSVQPRTTTLPSSTQAVNTALKSHTGSMRPSPALPGQPQQAQFVPTANGQSSEASLSKTQIKSDVTAPETLNVSPTAISTNSGMGRKRPIPLEPTVIVLD